LNGLRSLSFAQRRLAGYSRALTVAGISIDDALIGHAEMSDGFGYAETNALLRNPSPPTAILTASILTAMGAARAIADAGLKLGEDVSVITHDDVLSYIRNGEVEAPLFTATTSSIRAAGRHTAEMLLALIDAPNAPPPSVVWDTEFVLGRSTGPAPD
jgi:LacI family transcriptional regulator